jgi:hypothetical protein
VETNVTKPANPTILGTVGGYSRLISPARAKIPVDLPIPEPTTSTDAIGRRFRGVRIEYGTPAKTHGKG